MVQSANPKQEAAVPGSRRKPTRIWLVTLPLISGALVACSALAWGLFSIFWCGWKALSRLSNAGGWKYGLNPTLINPLGTAVMVGVVAGLAFMVGGLMWNKHPHLLRMVWVLAFLIGGILWLRAFWVVTVHLGTICM